MKERGPNLQNIPIRTKLGEEIRKAFMKDLEYIPVDYALMEKRILRSFVK